MKRYRLKPEARGYMYYIPGMTYDQDEAGEDVSVDYLVGNYPEDWEEVTTPKKYRLKPGVHGYPNDWYGKEFNGDYQQSSWKRISDLVAGHPDDWEEVQHPLNDLAARCHEASAKAGWYDNTPVDTVNKAAKISLIHSEISEALEGERKDLMDDKLPHRRAAEVEMADAVIRILDYCGWLGYDLGGAVEEKLNFNKTRPDHTREARAKEGGKKI